MTEVLIHVALIVGVVTLSLTALTTVIPYMDGWNRVQRDKWIRANAVAWACYSRGGRDYLRRTRKLAARYNAREGKP